MHSFYLDAIRNFEGYTPAAQWDYAQHTNGYGTRARYAGEVIDRAEAERRFQAEVSSARSIVEKAAPGADEGTKAALTSLTYNAGTSWIESGLGDAVRRGDLDQAREIFQKYNKAGGEVLPGLVSRRSQEALWIGNPDALAGAFNVADAGSTSTGMPPVIVDHADSIMSVARASEGSPRASVGQSGAHDVSVPDVFAREPKAERATHTGSMGKIATDALAAIVGVESIGPGGAAGDIARLAQLGRGSELAGKSREARENETRRV